MIKLYHELRKASPGKARQLVRKVLEQNNLKKYCKEIKGRLLERFYLRRTYNKRSLDLDFSNPYRCSHKRGKISIRLDNGSEFCRRGYKKRNWWQEMQSKLGAELDIITPGSKHLTVIIENAHRKDDEEF